MKTAHTHKVTDISYDMLSKLCVRYILLDIDNTIKSYGAPAPYEGIEAWLREMKGRGVRVVLCSNNFKSRVKPFSDALGAEYVSFCLKPSPFGFLRAKIRLRAKRHEILVVGDQVFTDIMGAKLLGLKALLVDPVSLENERGTVKFRRFLMKGFRKRIETRKTPF